MRLGRRIAVALAAVFVTLVALDTFWGVTGLGVFPVTVAARFVDDTSGRPIEGVSALTLPEASDAEDASWVADARQQARERADLPYPFRPWPAAGVSAPDGSIRVCADVRWCRHLGPISGPFRRNLAPYRGVSALLAEKEGFERVVVDCTKGNWTALERNGPDGTHATLDLGEIRLKRAR